jgi:hypothetical protein
VPAGLDQRAEFQEVSVQSGPITIRRHAIFKRQYRRVVAAAENFHNLTPEGQWALLRAEVLAESPDGQSPLLAVLDGRADRRDEVLAGLEEARISYKPPSG